MIIYRTLSFENLDEARVRETRWLEKLIQKKYLDCSPFVKQLFNVKETDANIYICAIILSVC